MSGTEFAQALWACPQMLGRVQSALRPDVYTLGEVELLSMLGHDAGRELDWADWPDARELAEMRKPRVCEPWSEELYPAQTFSLEEWAWMEFWGTTYGGVREVVTV